VLGETQAPEMVVEVLLQGVPDGPLGVGAAHVEGHLVQLVPGQLGASEDEADLRPVPVGDGHIPACFDHGGDVRARFARGAVLVLDRLVLGVLDE